jgi:hypothetical protein
VSSITIISDAPNCGVTYDCQSEDHNSFIIQATGAQENGWNEDIAPFITLIYYGTHETQGSKKLGLD